MQVISFFHLCLHLQAFIYDFMLIYLLGIIGLAISYALTITNSLSGFVTSFTETEKEMVAVERLH